MIPKNVLSTIIITGLIFLFCLGASVLFANAQIAKTVSAHSATAGVKSNLVTKTQVVVFTPTGVRSTAEQKGNCWINSLAVLRVNAWRCSVANTIYDPCFSASQTANYVLCDANPVLGNTNGVKVILSQPLPKPYVTVASTQQAWELRLSSGVACSFETGATFLVKGQRANYGCSDGSFVIGTPKVGSVWYVNVAKNARPNETTPPAMIKVAVTTVWT